MLDIWEAERVEDVLRYIRAKNLLHKIPIPHELVEENAAGEFAKEIAAYIRQHGVIGDGGR